MILPHESIEPLAGLFAISMILFGAGLLLDDLCIAMGFLGASEARIDPRCMASKCWFGTSAVKFAIWMIPTMRITSTVRFVVEDPAVFKVDPGPTICGVWRLPFLRSW